MIKKLLNPIPQFIIMLSADDRSQFEQWSELEEYWHAGRLPTAVFGSILPTVQRSQGASVDIEKFCTVGLGGLYRATNGLSKYWSSMDVSGYVAGARHELAFWLHWTQVSLDMVNTILSSQEPNAVQSVAQTYAIVQDSMIGLLTPAGNATGNQTGPVRVPAAEQLRTHLCSLHSHLLSQSIGDMTEDLQQCYDDVNCLISKYTKFFKTFLRQPDSFDRTVSQGNMYPMAVRPQANLFRSSHRLPPIPGY